MKKIQTLLMMFSLFFLFSFSYAETFPATVAEASEAYNQIMADKGDDYVSSNQDFCDFFMTNIDKLYEDLLALDAFNTGLETYNNYLLFPIINVDKPRIVCIFYNSNSDISPLYFTNFYGDSYYFAFFNRSGSTVDYCYKAFTVDMDNITVTGSNSFTHRTVNNNSQIVNSHLIDFGYPTYESYLNLIKCSQPLYYTSYDGSNIDETNCALYTTEELPEMENPLTDAEIKSILEIFLESVRNSDLPEHYGKYVLTYNKITGRYSGFIYPSYIDLGMEYFDYDDEDNRFRCDCVGPYYNFIVYREDNDYLSNVIDSISLLFKNPMIYEFRSNSTNTSFRFNTTYSMFGSDWDSLDIPFLVSTIDEPIIYTSHKIYSLFFIGNNLGVPQYVYDYESSIENQIFTDELTGLPTDTTINEYTDETNSNINLFSLVSLLFGFIFSFISFLVKFFTFIVSFIIVPASTTILPQEFVTGIEWLHTFAFGEILLWDIFSILFGVLLSLYIVKLIRSH